MTPEAFRAELDRLSLTQGQAGRLLKVGERTVRRWASEGGIPESVSLLLPRLAKAEAAKLSE